ncbi:Dps family protein [Sanyastnella coralliicola]|uniref:Dps family protein n=1 Tax=Sanyastnella coralliicola TaxID=3069118 RepID=UPI0027B900D8|nr:DNA starvation/stationary phase protection protein [Longitalea sp. SCSIO 12813]
MIKEIITDNGQLKNGTETKKVERLRPHALIGYQKDHAKKLSGALNVLLANYAVHYQKLLNFHWNVKGPDFFDVHEKFEQEYNKAKEIIDDVAERIRIFGMKPMSTMKAYLNTANIREVESDLTSDQMIEEILSDYQILLESLVDVLDTAIEIGDGGTEDLMKGYIKYVENNHWMWTAFSTKNK